jgi:hypothetical protein
MILTCMLALDLGRAVHSFGVPTFLLIDRTPVSAMSSSSRWVDISSLKPPREDIFVGPKNKRFLADPL